MIVPRSNLLAWVALVALPMALLGALLPALIPVALAFTALLVAVALLDAALSPGRLAGLRVRLAGVARLTQGRSGRIDIEIENAGRRRLKLRLGLPFPDLIESPLEELDLTLAPDVLLSRTHWEVRPLRRGDYRLSHCYLERPSPLGLWLVRGALPLDGEIRVYPDLVPACRSMAALFLPRGAVGVRHRRQVGRGREFEKLREYIPGDALGDIHWKATAKRGRPITKLFQIERTQEVYLIIDTSRLCARLSSPEAPRPDDGNHPQLEEPAGSRSCDNSQSVLDQYLTAALVTGQAAQRQGDLFGLITFSDKVHRFIPARGGRAHYNVCRDAIYALQPNRVTPDFDELFTTLRMRLRRRALLVFLTCLDDPTLAESFQRRIDLICRHHLVLVGMLAPPYARELFSDRDAGPGGAVAGEADLYQRLGGHMLWNDLRLLERSLARRGVHFALLGEAALVPDLVSQYLEIKQRQLL